MNMLQPYAAYSKKLLTLALVTCIVAVSGLQAQTVHSNLQAHLGSHPLAIGPVVPIDGDGPAEGGTPPNTLCTGATVEALEVDGSLVRNGDNTGALDDWFFGVPVVWEGFTTSECANVSIQYCGTDPAYEAALLYLGYGCPLSNYAVIPESAVTDQSCGDGNFELTITQLAPGTYYYPILMVPGSSEGPYTLTISATACTNTPPPSALCDGAIALTVNETCEGVAGSAENATVAGTISGGCEGGDPSDGIWYSFVATNTQHGVYVDPSADYSAAVDVFVGSCATPGLFTCFVAPTVDIDIDLQLSSLTIGETYYIRVYDWFAGEPVSNTFTICVTGEPALPCDADAGSITADVASFCYEDETITLSATPNGDDVVPEGFETVYVLTMGEDLVIMQAGATPSFDVDAVGGYTIHTLVYDPNTLDLGSIEIGVTTGGDVNALLIQGGGTICGSLDVGGAPILVELCCDAEAGTITADMDLVCYDADEVLISATGNGDEVVPDGFEVAYVLTSGVDLLVEDVDVISSFIVSAEGDYTIHTLVYDPNTLSLDVIVPGFTTAFNINGALIQGGGTICGSLDMTGAPITVGECCPADAGTLSANGGTACYVDGMATVSATANGDSEVPDGFETVYVLTMGEDLVIMQTGTSPSFEVDALGNYTIHTLVYDPNTLDLGIIEIGVTTGGDVNALLIQGGGTICGSLDVAGAPVAVIECCDAAAGTMTPDNESICLVDGTATVSGTPNGDIVIPSGFQKTYFLSTGDEAVIVQANVEPTFSVTMIGAYTIHTLVYDPNTLDLGSVELGVTTVAEVKAVLIEGGGTICGSVDVTGATTTVDDCCAQDAGTITANAESVCLEDGRATVRATPNEDAVVPDGYEVVFVLTFGEDLVIMQADAEPSFDVEEAGSYIIHTLVYDPNTLDLGVIEFGVTTAGEVNALLVQGGGSVCASLDLVGAPTEVQDCTPVNDDCMNAIELTINPVEDCPAAAVAGDNTNATQEDGNEPGCDETTVSFADVWYSFNSGSNTEVTLDLDPMDMESWGVTVSDACMGGTEIACRVDPTDPIVLTTAENTTYWVRVFSNLETGAGGEFTLCLSGATPTFICDGGEVSGNEGLTSISVCQDASVDVIDFSTTSTSDEAYSYVVTDEADVIVALMAGNSMDFNMLAVGSYRVYGFS
ncbi:MAG: hypothetical protein KDC00_03395, partial [Flavobacteriales bacterium]|nr:hypothetical protein [Flavobacteriales bacterium]